MSAPADSSSRLRSKLVRPKSSASTSIAGGDVMVAGRWRRGAPPSRTMVRAFLAAWPTAHRAGARTLRPGTPGSVRARRAACRLPRPPSHHLYQRTGEHQQRRRPMDDAALDAIDAKPGATSPLVGCRFGYVNDGVFVGAVSGSATVSWLPMTRKTCCPGRTKGEQGTVTCVLPEASTRAPTCRYWVRSQTAGCWWSSDRTPSSPGPRDRRCRPRVRRGRSAGAA